MKKFFLLAFLCLLIFSCSKDDSVPANSGPSEFALEDLSFTGNRLNLSWTAATDADEDRIYYNIYINSELVRGPITERSLSAMLEYNEDYEGEIIATDRNGGTSQITFSFSSPTSKIILTGDFYTGNLLAIDLYTRNTIWTAPSAAYVNSVKNGLVFTGFTNLSAYKLVTGEQVWETNPLFRGNDIGYRHLMVDDQFLIAKTSDDMLFSIDLQRREVQWELSLFQSIHMYSMDRNNVYVPKRNNADLISINKFSGEQEWGFSLDNSVSGLHPDIEHAPLIFNGNLYFQDNNGRFYSVNKTTGTKNYSLYIGKASPATPVEINGNIVFTSRDEIISLKSGNGEINWRFDLGAYSQSSPYEQDGFIYVGAGRDLFCLNAHTGNLEWQTNLGGEIYSSSPIVYEQKVYIGSNNANLHCLDAITGNMEWKVGNENFSIFSPTLVIGDTEEIIYPSNSGYYN